MSREYYEPAPPPYDPCLDDGLCIEDPRKPGWFVGLSSSLTTLGSVPGQSFAGEIGGHLSPALTLSAVGGHVGSRLASEDLAFIGVRPGLSLTPEQTFTLSGDLLLGVGAQTSQLGKPGLEPVNLIEPRLGAGVRLGSWGRLDGHAGFRHIPSSHPGSAALSGPTLGLGLRIGEF